MHINAARKHKLSRGIENLSSILTRKTLSDCSDPALTDGDVALVGVRSSNHAAIGDDSVEAHECIFSFNGEAEILC